MYWKYWAQKGLIRPEARDVFLQSVWDVLQNPKMTIAKTNRLARSPSKTPRKVDTFFWQCQHLSCNLLGHFFKFQPLSCNLLGNFFKSQPLSCNLLGNILGFTPLSAIHYIILIRTVKYWAQKGLMRPWTELKMSIPCETSFKIQKWPSQKLIH